MPARSAQGMAAFAAEYLSQNTSQSPSDSQRAKSLLLAISAALTVLLRVRYVGSFCRAGSMWARQFKTQQRHCPAFYVAGRSEFSALSKHLLEPGRCSLLGSWRVAR